MGFRPVGLYNSEGKGSCEVCGHPYPPSQLFWFDGKHVCRFHKYRRTWKQQMAQIQRGLKLFHGHHHIDSTVPRGIITGVNPPTSGGGGGGTDPGPGTGTPPGETPPTDPTANYVDGSCR